MITLVLGGARSGKSAMAERLAARLPAPVTYVATTVADDAEMRARVERHRARRPSSWRTVEAGRDLCAALVDLEGTVLVDALGPWVAAHSEFTVDSGTLCQRLTERRGDTVVVSEEVGLGVHPSSHAGRCFRDALGDVNQAVAGVADEVMLVVAGRVLRLEPIDLGEPSPRP